MADVWQTYGSWILYGIFFVLMVLMHAGMHGHAGHGRGRAAQGREATGSGTPAEGPRKGTRTGLPTGRRTATAEDTASPWAV